MVRKVGHIFVIYDGVVKEDVQDADTDCCTTYMVTDLDVGDAGTSLESLQEHILAKLTFHLIYWYI